MGDYERYMTRLRDHGIPLVAWALAEMSGVNVYIGYYHLARLTTPLPDGSQHCAIEFDDVVGKAPGIHIIIEEEVFHSTRTISKSAQKKGATLSSTGCAPPKVVHPAMPKGRVADQPRRLAQGCAQERWK